MKIAIVAPSPVPFAVGGAERAASGILRELRERTPHESELLKLPTPERHLGEIVAGYEQFARLDLAHFDLVLTNKYPAWIVDHPNHVAYVFHGLRALYDRYHLYDSADWRADEDSPPAALLNLIRRPPERALLDEFFGVFRQVWIERGPLDPVLRFPGPLAREIVQFLDAIALAPASVRRYLALSETVRNRREYFPANVAVEVLYLPPFLEDFRCGNFDYFFTTSRLADHKRMHLLIEAMRHVKHDVGLRIAGTGPEEARLLGIAGDDPRIQFLGLLSDQELLDAYADALAVPFAPLDEEMGLITIEAMRSGKPVVTVRDAGGPTEFVRQGVNGFVTEPTPAAIGAALSQLAATPGLAPRLGRAGRRSVEHITWPNTVRALLRHDVVPLPRRRSSTRPRLVAASPNPVLAADESGRRQLMLLEALSEAFDVEVVSLGSSDQPVAQPSVGPRLTETVVPRSRSHDEAEREVAKRAGRLPVGAAAAPALVVYTPEFLGALRRAARGAAGIVLCRPFLAHAAAIVAPETPIVLSVEQMEAEAVGVLADSEWLKGSVGQAESQALARARLVIASDDEDAAGLESHFGVDGRQILVFPPSAGSGALIDNGARAARRDQWLARYYTAVPQPPEITRLALCRAAPDPVDLSGVTALAAEAHMLPEILIVIAGVEPGHLGADSLPDNLVLLAHGGAAAQALISCADVALEPAPFATARADLRISEYLAAGTPVVSTPEAARGRSEVIAAPISGFRKGVELVHTRARRAPVPSVEDPSARVLQLCSAVAHVLGVPLDTTLTG